MSALPELGIHQSLGNFEFNKPWAYPLAASAIIAIARGIEFLEPNLSIRNILPEPLDIPDHIGNLGGFATFCLPVTQALAAKDNERVFTPEEHRRSKKQFAIFLGALTVGANLFGELVGYGPTSTPDPTDFVYGLFAGVMIYHAKKPNYIPESTINEVVQIGDEFEDMLNSSEEFANEKAVIERFKVYKNKIMRRRNPPATTKHTKPSLKKTSQRPRHQGRYTPPKPKK